jgi:hypothetical protein
VRTRLTGFVAAALAAIWVATGAAAGGGTKKLLDALSGDPAFKVRMQALRLLGKSAREKKLGDSTEEAIDAIGIAAKKDESHLVRGLAAFVLGQIGDPRARPLLDQVMKDPNPFVRVQAEDALKLLPAPQRQEPRRPPDVEAPPPGNVAAVEPVPGAASGLDPEAGAAAGAQPAAKLPALVITIEDTPGVQVPQEIMNDLGTMMRDGVSEKSAGRFAVSSGQGRSGFRLLGSIAERKIEDTGAAETKVTLVVRIAIATWPANNLRHVVSARASAASKSRHGAAVKSLERQVLRAAVATAVRDAMQELSKKG